MDVLLLLILVGIAVVVVRRLSAIERKLKTLTFYSEPSVHDTIHPVFSRKEIRFARLRFEATYRKYLLLNEALKNSDAWRKRTSYADLPKGLRTKAHEVFDFLVRAEDAWERYEAMVIGNSAVAHRGESAENVLQTFSSLPYRGLTSSRADARLTKWLARLDALPNAPRNEETGEPILPEEFELDPSPLFLRLHEYDDLDDYLRRSAPSYLNDSRYLR
jgi:hypothetical protein